MPAVDAARGSPDSLALVNPSQAASLFASILFLLASGPRLRELLLFLVGTVGFAMGHRAWLGLFSFRGVRFEQSALVAAGLASVVALGSRAADSDRGSEPRGWFQLAVMLPAFGMVMALALDLTFPLHAWAWDPIVLGLDAAFGQPSFAVGRVAASHPSLLTLLSLVYLFLPVALAGMLVLERRHSARERGLLRPFLLAAVVGYALYQVYPVVGPGPLFGTRFPYGAAVLPGPPQHRIDVTAISDPRNCMPSLHVAWALLIYWHARALGKVARAAGAVWLVSTIFATLAMGQHYFVDLVVAVPFAAVIDALAAGGGSGQTIFARRRLIATAGGLLAIWYADPLSGAARRLGRAPAAAAGGDHGRRQLGDAGPLERSALVAPGGDLPGDFSVQLGPQDHDVGRQQEPGEDRDDDAQRTVDPIGLGVSRREPGEQRRPRQPQGRRHHRSRRQPPARGRHVRRPVVVGDAQGHQDHHRQHRPAAPADQLLPQLRHPKERKNHGKDDHRCDGDDARDDRAHREQKGGDVQPNEPPRLSSGRTPG